MDIFWRYYNKKKNLLFQVQEYSVDYTYCNSSSNPLQTCADYIGSSRNLSCHCTITFSLTEDFSVSSTIYIYSILSMKTRRARIGATYRQNVNMLYTLFYDV